MFAPSGPGMGEGHRNLTIARESMTPPIGRPDGQRIVFTSGLDHSLDIMS